MYFGNNQGILEYDGRKWNFIDPAYIVCARRNSKGEIFVGGREDFGKLQVNEKGQIKFLSFKNLLPEKFRDIRFVRHIALIDNRIYFSDENGRLMIFENGEIQVKEIANYLGVMEFIDDKLYLNSRYGFFIYADD